ncbi:MAG: MoaD family protein [Synergistaceae bacterium]|jgi:MoaD family protein|nr:MoaD family protein [Synergistaceae bacterium]
MIQVSYFAHIREMTGKKEESVATGGTVLDLMRALCGVYGARFRAFCMDGGDSKISRNLNILVNGKHIHHLKEGLTPLKDGDAVAIFPLIGGG